MPRPVDPTRRLALPMMAAATVFATARPVSARGPAAPATQLGLDAASNADQSARLQAAIDQATNRGTALQLPPGRIVAGGLRLRPGTQLLGAAGAGTILSLAGNGPILAGSESHNVVVDGITFDGLQLPMDVRRGDALVSVDRSRDVILSRLTVRNSALGGIKLIGVSGRVHDCHLSAIATAALWSLDATGLEISHNTVVDCANNGILVWRSRHGDDATMVSHNRISRIHARAGGSGQNGNGINIYRAARVQAAHNSLFDCAYSAIRANESSNVQMLANSAARIGEVAFYAEAAAEVAGAAGFEGAILASNLVDGAAAGLVVTNFNNGGRLAVVQGNLVRNLSRREHEAVDKRGEGIAVEADAIVSNNVIETAPTCGIMIGWGKYMREVIATGNLIRNARIGIAVAGDSGGGQCMVTNNMIAGARDGAVRAMSLAVPIGPDLAIGTAKGPRHLTVTGNIVS